MAARSGFKGGLQWIVGLSRMKEFAKQTLIQTTYESYQDSCDM